MSEPKRQAVPRPPFISLILGLWIFPTLWLGCFVIIAYSTIHSTMGRMRGKSGSDAKRQHTSATKTHYSDQVGEECPICQERIGSRSPEGIRESWSMLPCGHRFGSYCIKRYLGISADEEPLCPMCRDRAYHEVCGHPVLPFMLRPDGTHPDLIIDDVSGRVRPRKGEDFLTVIACEYCQDPEGHQRRPVEELQPKWKTPVRWLWERMPFTRKRTVQRPQVERPGPARDDDQHSNEYNRRERIRNQRNGGPWHGPWMDVRSRDLGWEKWWKEQAPCGV